MGSSKDDTPEKVLVSSAASRKEKSGPLTLTRKELRLSNSQGNDEYFPIGEIRNLEVIDDPPKIEIKVMGRKRLKTLSYTLYQLQSQGQVSKKLQLDKWRAVWWKCTRKISAEDEEAERLKREQEEKARKHRQELREDPDKLRREAWIKSMARHRATLLAFDRKLRKEFTELVESSEKLVSPKEFWSSRAKALAIQKTTELSQVLGVTTEQVYGKKKKHADATFLNDEKPRGGSEAADDDEKAESTSNQAIRPLRQTSFIHIYNGVDGAHVIRDKLNGILSSLERSLNRLDVSMSCVDVTSSGAASILFQGPEVMALNVTVRSGDLFDDHQYVNVFYAACQALKKGFSGKLSFRNLTCGEKAKMFLKGPHVYTAFREMVPSRMTEVEFWNRYFRAEGAAHSRSSGRPMMMGASSMLLMKDEDAKLFERYLKSQNEGQEQLKNALLEQREQRSTPKPLDPRFDIRRSDGSEHYTEEGLQVLLRRQLPRKRSEKLKYLASIRKKRWCGGLGGGWVDPRQCLSSMNVGAGLILAAAEIRDQAFDGIASQNKRKRAAVRRKIEGDEKENGRISSSYPSDHQDGDLASADLKFPLSDSWNPFFGLICLIVQKEQGEGAESKYVPLKLNKRRGAMASQYGGESAPPPHLPPSSTASSSMQNEDRIFQQYHAIVEGTRKRLQGRKFTCEEAAAIAPPSALFYGDESRQYAAEEDLGSGGASAGKSRKRFKVFSEDPHLRDTEIPRPILKDLKEISSRVAVFLRYYWSMYPPKNGMAYSRMKKVSKDLGTELLRLTEYRTQKLNLKRGSGNVQLYDIVTPLMNSIHCVETAQRQIDDRISGVRVA
eukprot:jgi/Bigna1/69705/fgenesh1_pg.9_\